ncbi:MAG: hypothetical protein J07HQW1_02318 [Haloquadratum walsbyi J07HQW1]|jgi:hypothetical protein|uniref:Uncharacterized protein n=1 Tax=Haloquadratum walsbyi J07HQW1 TaxID=1238424 RepID=U1N736_9EURY|nr:MAG: hypothetical protein J07HQW1_02318 [Haloquadratum walsbyi J07HQW1]
MWARTPINMSVLHQTYYRVDNWVRGLSRIRYAILVGIVSAVGVWIVSLFTSSLNLFYAVALGVSNIIVFYWFNP